MRNITLVLAIIAVALIGITVLAEDVKTEPLIIIKPVIYPDPILDHDWSATKHNIPPMYDPEGKTDPFMVILPAQEKADEGQLVAKDVPTTPLTKWRVSQLKLTSVIVNHVFAYAYFTTPENSKVYRGEVGNYVGKYGSTIASIKYGVVSLTDGTNLSIDH